MKKILVLSALLGSVMGASALPTWEPFVSQPSGGTAYAGGNGGTLLANQTNASGEVWNEWTSTTVPVALSDIVTNFDFNAISLNGYSLPAPYSPLPTNSVWIPNNPAGPGKNGDGACLGFSSVIFPPAGKANQYGAASTNRVFVSFLLDVPNVNNTGSATYFAGFVNSAQVKGNFNGTPSLGSNDLHFNIGAGSGLTPYALGIDSTTGASLTSTFFQSAPYDSANVAYYVVIDYELAGTNVSNTITNDKANLWINPVSSTFGAALPPSVTTAVAGVKFAVPAAQAVQNIGGLYVLARTTSTYPTNGFYIADTAVGTTWAYVTGGAEFTTQPASANIADSGSVVLTSAATAINGQTITYQWQRNGASLTDGTTANGTTLTGTQTATLTIANLASADSGTYTSTAATPVSTANGYSTPSSPAVITADPLIISYTTNLAVAQGSGGTLSVNDTTSFTPFTYQWQKNGASLNNGVSGTGTTYAGVQTSSLTISTAAMSDNNATYTCIASNANGSVAVNGPMILAVQGVVVSQPTPATQTANYGSTVSLTAVVTPSGSYTYQWLLNGNPVSDPHASGANTATLTITGVSYIDNGSYTLSVNSGAAVSVSPAVLTVFDPIIVTQPANTQVTAGQPAVISVSAAGSSLSYQWQSNGVALSDVPGVVAGSSTSALTISSAQDADDASYTVTVNGASGAPTNSIAAVLSVLDPVAVQAAMRSYTVNAGVHVAFTPVITSGTAPFTYQWFYNGSALAGVTSSSLVLSNVQSSTNGTYSVFITNNIVGGTSYGSASATLTVTPTLINLPSANVIVARVGDGAQALSANTGNTLYLDQFTSGGTYVASTMIPDSGPNALVVAGGGTDAQVESVLTTSSNGAFINFAGFNTNVISGRSTDIGSGTIRAIGAISTIGTFIMAETNVGLHSAGVQNRSVASQDGLYQFWSTGDSNGMQYTTPFVNQNGQGLPTVSPGSYPDLRVVELFPQSGTLYLSGGSNDAAQQDGLFYFNAGAPTTAAAGASVIFNGNSGYDPSDFAISPDGATIYVADDNTIANGGGIQRWDNGSLSYTLSTGAGSKVGVRGIVVNWGGGSGGSWGSGVGGETVYATTAETSGNRLVTVNDDASGSSTASTLQTAGANQIFRGVRFGPAGVAPTITAQPQSQTALAGTTVTFSVTQVTGTAPFSYQSYSNGVSVAGATSSSYSIPNVTPSAAGGSGYYVVVNNGYPPAATSQAATLNVLTTPPSIAPMQSWTVGANTGVRVVITPVVSGAYPLTYSWTSNGVPISVTGTNIIIVNPTVPGTYTYHVSVSNPYGGPVSGTATLTVLPTAGLSTANLEVTRIGDGAQALSSSLGNTIYMDQFQPNGSYVSSLMIPDSGQNACVVGGGSPDGVWEGVLTSSTNDSFLNICGFLATLPNTNNADIGANSAYIRVIGAISGTGIYTRTVTNIGLYSAGTEIRAAGSSDGLVNYWTTGAGNASSPGIKYINPTLAPSGSGIPEVAAAGPTDTRVVQVLSNSTLGNNFVYTTGTSGSVGLYLGTGNVQTTATVTALITETSGSPNDFAVSPDLKTIYIADDGSQGGGGIQRWDTNTSSTGYNLTYTLTDSTGSGGTNGFRGLAVNWGSATSFGAGANGETLFATTSEAATNRLVEFADNGAGSSDTLLDTAFANELFRGVRFGPSAVAASIVTAPSSESVEQGATADFTVAVSGTSPFFYQWYSNNVAIAGATGAAYSITNVQMFDAASYTVTVNNGIGSPATSTPAAVLTVVPFNVGTGLVGWWKLNDGSGTVAADSSGYNDPGALDNFQANPWVAGFGQQFSLEITNADNAQDNAVVVPDAPQLNFNANLAMTISAWIRSETNNQISGAGLIAKGYGNGGEQFDLDVYSNAFRFFVRSSAGAVSGVTSAVVPPVGQWEHVAATFDGNAGVIAVYVNGALIGSAAGPANLLPTTRPLIIGSRPNSSTSTNNFPFYGEMEDVRVYNISLGASDIQAIYQTLATAGHPWSISTNSAFVGTSQFQLNMSGAANTAYRLWTTTDPSLTPVTSTWTLLQSGTFNSAGTATFTDTAASSTSKYYVLTQP